MNEFPAPGPIPAWIERITGFGPRMRTALRWTLLVSLLVHLLTVPLLLSRSSSRVRIDLEKSKNTYLSKMVQTQRSKLRRSEIRAIAEAPLTPPDPEKFASKTIAEATTRDVLQVTKGLVPVALQQSLAEHIQTSLKDEIQEAAKKMAAGQVSAEQLKEMQKKWEEQAFVVAGKWGEQVREDTQIDVASESVTDWYERRVAKQFKDQIRQGLFTDDRGPWRQFFVPENAGFLRHRHDDSARSLEYELTLDHLDRILKGRFTGEIKGLPEEAKGKMKPLEHGWWTVAENPSLAHAALVAHLLATQSKTWDAAWGEYCARFYPHRVEEMSREKAAMDATWKQLLSAAEDYRKQAAKASPEQLAAANQAVLDQARLLRLRGERLALRFRNMKEAECAAVNQAIRSRLVRGTFLDELHTYLVERFVERIKPAVVNLAQNQFREGMVYSKQGVQKAIKDFGVSSVSLLRRDISEALTKPALRRALFMVAANPYKSELTGKSCPPSEEDIARDEQALQKAVADWSEVDRVYVDRRTLSIQAEIKTSAERTIEELLRTMVTKDGVLERRFYLSAESVDYTDQFQKRLEIRNMALKGRGQNVAELTDDGVPDTTNPLVALTAGLGAGQVALQPYLTSMRPTYMAENRSAMALRCSQPSFPPARAPWGFVPQIKIKPPFESPACEAIPFLVQFPNFDGDLSDWGGIRPLLLPAPRGDLAYLTKEPLKLYLGWNYQGFFFGYHVPAPKRFFFRSSEYERGTDGISLVKRREGDYGWVIAGDCLVMCFDTIDTRAPMRGDPNTQEFYVFPKGTDSDPTTPGAERVVASRRDSQMKTEWGNYPFCKCSFTVFPPQPKDGPDGSGPYRVARFTDDGYTVEGFLPRSLFKAPMFSPGWYIGFDCAIGVGELMRGDGQPRMGNYATWQKHLDMQLPASWGDLLLLGTDAEMTVLDASPGWPRSTAVTPGHSYLVTVIDPSRNVNLAAPDTVLVSAEVLGEQGSMEDVEVLILKETGNNTNIFRGFINTQPGCGKRVHGVVEVMPGQVVRFAYTNFADSKGRRNVVFEEKLPVVAPVMGMNGNGEQ
jgi:hypothetical protein